MRLIEVRRSPRLVLRVRWILCASHCASRLDKTDWRSQVCKTGLVNWIGDNKPAEIYNVQASQIYPKYFHP